jgi:hypothetical protein
MALRWLIFLLRANQLTVVAARAVDRLSYAPWFSMFDAVPLD